MMLFCPVTKELCSKVKATKKEKIEILTCGVTGETLASLVDRNYCPKKEVRK